MVEREIDQRALKRPDKEETARGGETRGDQEAHRASAELEAHTAYGSGEWRGLGPHCESCGEASAAAWISRLR